MANTHDTKRARTVAGMAGIALAFLTLSATALAQDAEPPGPGCVLLETRSFGEGELGAARDYANSYSGPTGASIDGVAFVYRSTIRTVRGGMGNRVAIVKIWACPPAAPLGGGGGVVVPPDKGKKDDKPPKPPVGPDVPTFDPRTHELRDGRVVPRRPPVDEHRRCERPGRFECGQHYLWWLQNHEHLPRFDFGEDLENTPAAQGEPEFDFGQRTFRR
jgi:hypothetical protein